MRATVVVDTEVDAGGAGLLSVSDHETDAMPETGADDGVGAGRGPGSASHQPSRKISRWTTMLFCNFYCRKASKSRSLANDLRWRDLSRWSLRCAKPSLPSPSFREIQRAPA